MAKSRFPLHWDDEHGRRPGLSDPRNPEARAMAHARRPTSSTTPLPVAEESGHAVKRDRQGVMEPSHASAADDCFS